MSKKQKLLSLFLVGLMSLSAVSCKKKNGGEEGSNQDGGLKIWTAPSYVKVLQDVDYSQESTYAGYYEDGVLDVSMYKNESEAGQIILTSDSDISAYSIEISDLTAEGGAKIPKEALTLYNQKYMEVVKPSATQTNGIMGMTPDALLPFDVAVAYGENRMAANTNQGIVIDVKTTEETPAGKYSGEFTLTVDGKSSKIPVNVTVHDVTIPKTNNLKTSFLLTRRYLNAAELDDSREIYEQYYEQMLDYRICLTYLPYDGTLDGWIASLKKYTADDRVSTIDFYDTSDWNAMTYKFDKYAEILKTVVEESYKDGVNYLDKCVYYLAIIDEPHITKTTEKVAPIMKGFAKVRHQLMDELRANRASYEVEEEFFQTMLTEIENFHFVVTTSMREGEYSYENNKSTPEDPQEEYKITWCPAFDQFGSQTSIDKHRNEDMDSWWYGCNYPVNPYVNYHLDEELIPARVCSWMQYNYNIVGNLYWAINNAVDQNIYQQSIAYPEAKDYETPEDFYKYAVNMSTKTNGEGILTYPGKPYGIYGFVPTLRLLSIRDGMEDYEILKVTGASCTALATSAGYENYDVNDTFSKLYEALYQGVKVVGTHQDFTKSQEQLTQFAIFAEKGTVLADVQNKTASTEVKVFAQSGSITVDGIEPAYVAKGTGKEYTIEVQQTEEANYLRFTLEQEGEKTEFSMYVGGKKAKLPLNELTYGGVTANDKITATPNQDGSVSVVAKNETADMARFSIKGDIMPKNLKKGIKQITIEIENTGSEFTLDLKFIGTRNDTVREWLKGVKITTGINLITLDTATMDFSPFGAMKEWRVELHYPTGTQTSSFTLKTIALTY